MEFGLFGPSEIERCPQGGVRLYFHFLAEVTTPASPLDSIFLEEQCCKPRWLS